MKKIRTRYAPSPTGYLHIGGARTALFCYLFAKVYQGDFILRIEDTDVARNVENGEASQLNNLAWLGIIPDESPINPNPKYGKYRQSEKLDRYQQIANYLMEQNIAYKAYDTKEEIEQQREEQRQKGLFSFRYDRNWLKISGEEKAKRDQAKQYSIRIALPKNHIYSWDDIVRKNISVNSDEVGDWVIIKSDGYPTYNFAVVIDDHDMEITHILRGEEHITNTPKQLSIYEAMKWEVPQFGHLTIITNMQGEKLSKRDFSVKQFIEDYKNEGYLPEAIFNFLALLGWTSADASEIMSKDELIQKFDPARLSKSPSKFDIKKMEWFSKKYFQNLSNEIIIQNLPFNISDEWMNLFVTTYKENNATYSQLKENLQHYLDKDLVVKDIDPNITNIEVVKFLKEKIEEEFSLANIQNTINEIGNIFQLKGKQLFLPIRLITTYQEHGPELAKAIYLYGKITILERINKWISNSNQK